MDTSYIKPSLLNRMKRRDKRMSEELIECRRWGGGKINKKIRDKGRIKRYQQDKRKDTLPYQESISGKLKTAWPEDNLEPLIRFLQSNCGKEWNKVYSKLNKQLDRRSVTGLHVIDHLWDFVCINTKMEKGKIVYYDSWGRMHRATIPRWFYVHPATGILHSNRYEKQKGPFPKKARWKKQKEKEKLKRKLGIKPKETFKLNIPQVQTIDQHVKPGRLYDLELENLDCPEKPIFCRVKIEEVGKGKFGFFVKLRVLKVHKDQPVGGQMLTLYQHKMTIYRGYYHRASDQRRWLLRELGSLEIARKRAKDFVY